MAKIKLSDFIVKRLKEKYNVKNVFMVSGGGAMHLNDSFGKYMSYICNHHEQACAIAAEGYARVKQNLAVVNVTTGPGGLNCLNGVFGQWTDSVPVLYISGQVKYTTCMDSCKDIPLRQLGDQEVDIISCVQPLTKYAVTVFEPNEIKYHLDRAVYEATTGRKGPVWLNIPMNIQSAIIEEDDLKEFVPPKSEKKNNFHIEEVINKFKSAKKPLIVAGHGVRLSGQIDNFLKLIEKLNLPVVTTFNGMDLISKNHPLYIGRIGTIGQRAGNFALQNADLLLELGTRNNIRQVSYNWENFGKNAFKIIVDIDKAELEKPLVKADLPINADLADFIPELISACNSKIILKSLSPNWIDYCKSMKNKYSFENHPEHIQTGNVINPYYFTRILISKLSKNDTLVSANATPSICIFQVGDFKGERIIVNSGNASMGFALPASIGASLQTEGRTIAFEGDGSIMMNLQELETIAYNKIPIKIFVINNEGYSSIRQSQKNFFNGHMTGSGTTSGVGVPDFIKVAESFGIKTVKIQNSKNMENEIEYVLNYDGSIFCEVCVEKEYIFAPKLSSRKLDDGTMISATLEDMFPFLPRDEFEENMIN